jgi:hypothetical protein
VGEDVVRHGLCSACGSRELVTFSSCSVLDKFVWGRGLVVNSVLKHKGSADNARDGRHFLNNCCLRVSRL